MKVTIYNVKVPIHGAKVCARRLTGRFRRSAGRVYNVKVPVGGGKV